VPPVERGTIPPAPAGRSRPQAHHLPTRAAGEQRRRPDPLARSDRHLKSDQR